MLRRKLETSKVIWQSILIVSRLQNEFQIKRILCFADRFAQNVKINAKTVEIEERGVKLRLTVVDTPGYGDAIDNADWWVDSKVYYNS